jgi:hypothetical protein
VKNNVKRQMKPIVALASGAILLFGLLSPTVQAQSTVISSATSTLAPSVIPSGGYGANPEEYLVISWSVTESIANIFTYSYTVENPAGDVLLNPDGTLTPTPNSVNNFEVTFNTTAPGAYLPGSIMGGAFDQASGVGLTWDFNAVTAGSSSALLTFQSTLGPNSGDAGADGGSPPAPWSSTSLNGQQVPVPGVVMHTAPEPATTTLLALALLLLPFRSTLREKLAAKDGA